MNHFQTGQHATFPHVLPALWKQARRLLAQHGFWSPADLLIETNMPKQCTPKNRCSCSHWQNMSRWNLQSDLSDTGSWRQQCRTRKAVVRIFKKWLETIHLSYVVHFPVCIGQSPFHVWCRKDILYSLFCRKHIDCWSSPCHMIYNTSLP